VPSHRAHAYQVHIPFGPSLNLQPNSSSYYSDTAVARLLQLHESRAHPIGVALCNSFGFGGTNATLVMAKFQQ
jgi:3-oxoacyl-(acyl-carrier-protein) synthase